MELGDRIAIVAGVPAPLILRPYDPFMVDWFKSEYRCVCSAVVLWPSDIRPLSRGNASHNQADLGRGW